MSENRKCQKSKRMMGQGLQHFKKMLQYGNQTLAAVNFVKYDYLQQIGYN